MGTDTRTRMLVAGTELFRDRGYDGTGFRDVVARADAARGSIYHHFPDKPALAAAVYAQVMTEYQDGFLAMLREQVTAEDGIRGGVRNHLGWVAAHRGEAALLLGDRLDSAALRESNGNFFAGIRDWWRPHHTYGALVAMQPGVTAALWLGPAQEYTRYWVAGRVPDMDSEVVETFADAAWKALRGKRIEEDF